MSDLSLSVGRPGLKQQALLPILDTLAEMYHCGQTLPRIPELADTSDMDLRTLLEVLFRLDGIVTVKEFFTAHAYRVSQPCKGSRFEDVVVGIKYIDGLNNLWRPRWSREARGRFYYYDTATRTVLALKETVQRGVEVLTKAHTSAAITETQDMRLGAYEHLDDAQQACIAAFQQVSAPMDAVLTGKVDGSLMIVSVYPRGTAECRIMEEILATCGDAFAHQLADACRKDEPLIVVATQGTLFIGSDMQDYFLTALQSLLGPLPSTVQKKVASAWAYYAPLFVAATLAFVAAAATTALAGRRVHLCFEAFCRYRRTFTGHLHTELAVSYDHDGFNLLGVMVEGGTYVPHFDLPAVVFAQPIYLRISDTRQIFAIMEDMDRVVLGDLESAAFMDYYGFPAAATIHMEGWVLLTPLPACSGYDYAKIKTLLYYKCHKVRSREVPALLALPTSCDATYPILTVLREFYTNADRRIAETVTRVVAMLEAEVALGPSSAFYTALAPKARLRFVPDPEKRDVLMRMLISCCADLFKARLVAILRDVWELETVHDDMVHLVRTLLMKHTPWATPLSAEARREAMEGLYSVLVESMTPA